MNSKTGVSAFSASIIFIFLIISASHFGSSKPTPYITISICMLGVILGWIVAIITTPYDKKDEDSSLRFTKLVGTFLTGYILSKSDEIFKKILSPEFIFSKEGGWRLILFLSFSGLSWVVVYVFRLYSSPEEKPITDPTTKNQPPASDS